VREEMHSPCTEMRSTRGPLCERSDQRPLDQERTVSVLLEEREREGRVSEYFGEVIAEGSISFRSHLVFPEDSIAEDVRETIARAIANFIVDSNLVSQISY